MIEDISKQLFLDSIKTRFTVRVEQGPSFELELNDVVDHGSTAKQEQFSLIFLAPKNAHQWQGIYSLDHPTLGNVELFLVPIALDEAGLHFEAVINRFRDGN
jgi:hypothetical protein